MPELPEVETVRLGLLPVLEGALIAKAELRRGDLRSPFPPRLAARLTGRRVTRLKRRAKFLLAELDDGQVLAMHLGMSGSFRIEEAASAEVPGRYYHARPRLAAHDHVVLTLDSGVRVVYNDPRRFGMMDLVGCRELETVSFLKGLGPEPLDDAFDAGVLAARLAGRAAPLKAVLLDQRTVAGLGNIYVCEALWKARLSPLREAGSIVTTRGRPTDRCAALAAAIKEVLRDAIRAGGSSLRDHARTDGTLGLFQHHFRVYDRQGEPCPRNRGTIRRIVQSGRSTFYCPVCQR